MTQNAGVQTTARNNQRTTAWRQVPALLVGMRFLLGPILLLAAVRGTTGAWFILAIIAAFLSDVFDGIIARRLGVAAERLRVADSWTDALFYICLAASAWRTRPEAILRLRLPLAALLALQFCSWAIDLVRYRRIASFHAYTAKAWGAALFAAALALFLPVDPVPFLWLVVAFGLLSNIEGIAIKLLLPAWRHDIPSVWHALRLRRAEQPAGVAKHRPG